MKIVKRNGEKTNFSPNKILTRIKKTAKGLNVNSDELAIEVQTYLFDGITTQEIDDQTAKLSAQYAINHPDYSLLASRIISSKLHKDFGIGIEPWKRRLKGLISDIVFEKQEKWGVEPNYEYDETFDFLGISSFITVYGVRQETYDPITDIKTSELRELPAEMMFRVALYLSESKEEFEKRYASLTNRYSGGATPVVTNAGTHNSTMISCSVNELMGDSLEGIHDTLKSIDEMSKGGSGIGLWLGNLRSDQTRYANKGKAGGVQRLAKIVDMHLRFFKQNECYSNQAEILTNKGFVKFNELNIDTKVASIDNNRTISFVVPSARQVYEHNGVLINVKKDGVFDYNVTPNHDVVYAIKDELSLFKKSVSDIEYTNEIESVIGGCYLNNIGISITNNDILGIIMSNTMIEDGALVFINDTQFEYAIQHFRKMGIDYKADINYRKVIIPTNLLKTKVSIDDFSLLSSNTFIKPYNYLVSLFTNPNVVLSDEVKLIQDTLSAMYMDGEQIERMNVDLNGLDTIKTEVEYNGEVYCVTVPSGMIIVRENGKIFASGNSRRGKGAIYLPLWHRDLYKFIELASKEGSEETTARDLMTALVINDLFYKRLLNEAENPIDKDGNIIETNGKWSLFCPHEVKRIMGYNLYDYWGDEFEKRFIECEQNPNLPKTSVSTDDVIRWVCNMQSKSGHPYVLNIDNVNKVNNQSNYGIIKTSQLCAEIVQVTGDDLSSQCCLGAMLLASFVENGKFNLNKLREESAQLNYMLNRVIEKNEWSNKYSEKGGTEQRATAIGVCGLADAFYAMGIPFESDEARQLNKEIFENIYYGAIEGSIQYRQENPNSISDEVKAMLDNTEVGRGRFVWEKYENTETTLDWDALRSRILELGVSNSMFCATMPTASCQVVDTEIITEDGVKSFADILTEGGIDYKEIEKVNKQEWFTLESPISVKTMTDYTMTDKIYYNGHHQTYNIEMEDGTIFKATPNHQFLINRNGEQVWVRVDELNEEDDIVNIK